MRVWTIEIQRILKSNQVIHFIASQRSIEIGFSWRRGQVGIVWEVSVIRTDMVFEEFNQGVKDLDNKSE